MSKRPIPFAFQWLVPAVFTAALALYLNLLLSSFTPREEVGGVSLAFKSTLTLMSLAGLFVINKLRGAQHRAYWPLALGFMAFSAAFCTDSAAEIVRTSYAVKLLGERVGLVLGFCFVLWGHYRWSLHTQEMTDRLARLALVDELTGLANRREFVQELRRLMALHQRHPDMPFAAIAFDLDHFKQINDTQGHQAGDQVLQEVAKAGTRVMRVEDVFARVGGEEFIVLLPATNLEGAHRSAQRLRSGLAQVRRGPTSQVTASFGVCEFRPGESEDSFLRRLDQGVYQSKHEGRDRITVQAAG